MLTFSPTRQAVLAGLFVVAGLAYTSMVVLYAIFTQQVLGTSSHDPCALPATSPSGAITLPQLKAATATGPQFCTTLTRADIRPDATCVIYLGRR